MARVIKNIFIFELESKRYAVVAGRKCKLRNRNEIEISTKKYYREIKIEIEI